MKPPILKAMLSLAAFASLTAGVGGCATPVQKVEIPQSTVIKGIRIDLDEEFRSATFGAPLVGVSGLATNETGRRLRMLALTLGVYDKDGVKISAAHASTTALEVGAKWRFDAIFSSIVDRKSQYHEVRIEDVTGIYAD